ncbi:MAG TPA: hypothetical protein VF054_05350, partial [Micromonosporaceae bacterium]
TRTSDLYGTTLDAERLRDRLHEVLDVEFVARESSFKGDYYLAGSRSGEHFEIQPNQIPGDWGEWDLMEEDFAEYPMLLYVYRTERADELRNRLREVPELVHLRRRVRE